MILEVTWLAQVAGEGDDGTGPLGSALDAGEGGDQKSRLNRR